MTTNLTETDEFAYKRKVTKSVKAALRFVPYDSTAKGRSAEFDAQTMTSAEVDTLLERQKYKCALTGLKFWTGGGSCRGHHPRSPTKDRLDTDGPYTLANVRIVLGVVNSMRGRGTDEEMYEIAEALLVTRRVPPTYHNAPEGGTDV